jgi:HlyD family secretion protein
MRSLMSIVLVVGLVGGGLGLWYWYNSGSAAVSYKTVPVERGSLMATISATGTLEPEEVIDVGAQVAGQIKTFGQDPKDSRKWIDYGSQVEAGTVLARIDEALYRSQVEQAKANVQRSEADLLQLNAKLHQAERDWKRAKELGPRRVISDLDFDTIQATYESCKSALAVGDAAIAQSKASLQQAEINLGYCTICSPVKGVIIDRRVNVGQTVVASLNAPSLFLIAKDLSRMQVWASVNEADVGSIRPGQSVHFTVDAYPGETFRGTVSQIRLNASMTQNVVTYTVVVTADNSSGKLLPYLTANLQFEVAQHDAVLLVPNAALRWRPQPQQVAPDAREAFVKGPGRSEKGAEKSGPARGPGEKKGPAGDRKGGAGDKGLARRPAESEPPRQERGTIWVEDGEFVRPIRVKLGLNDGVNTEIDGEGVKEGMLVIVAEIRQAGAEGGTTNPFAPQLFGGGKPKGP